MVSELVGNEIVEVKFSFYYCVFSLLSTSILVLVYVLCEGVTAFGVFLYSPEFLVAASIFEILKVGLCKLLTGHVSSLRLPLGPVHDSKPIKGPFLRKVWIKGSRFVWSLAPLVHLLKGILVLVAFWTLLTYITVCLGAPVTTHWVETGSFTALLLILTAYPILLTKGPSFASLREVLLSEEPGILSFSSFSSRQGCSALGTCLYYNTLLTLAGAWIGAFPIPLDWDRDWQVWPITCCLGSVLGSILSNFLGAVALCARVAQISSKRKYV